VTEIALGGATVELEVSHESDRVFDSSSGALTQGQADQRRLAQLQAKRLFDITVALALLVALLPMLLLVALLVRISSPGPVIFKQQRLGRHGRVFWFYKFRTMVQNNDPSEHQAYCAALIRGEAQPIGGSYKLADDARVTPIGAILRRYSLDEFPQLFNVLFGHMSLVGPRPPLAYESELYGPREWQRLDVTPGLTGLWQVSGRSALSFQEMIDLDLRYIESWSLWLDLEILARTPKVVITGRGAC
jgi:lipopolysaccharide/colanic/teichoic acid biosynthesis glycosyltransferase